MKQKKIRFPIRFPLPWNWPLPGQFALAFAFIGISILVRWFMDDSMGNRFPFLLLYAALLSLVQLVRPQAFFAAAIAGWIISVYLFQPVRMSFRFASALDALTATISALVFLLTAIIVWLAHRSRDRHKLAQNALAEAEKTSAHLAAIVSSSHDAIASKTLDGVITSWNDSAERLFGYSAQEAMGQSIMMLLPEERAHEESDILARLRSGERIDNFETVRRRKDGSLFDVALTVSPIRSKSGKIIGASKTARDITARKRTEQQLLDADRRKDEFLATLAHELRNPLAAISLGVNVLDSAKNDPSLVTEMSALIERQTAQLKRLIDDLMDADRISQGKIKLDQHSIELDTLVQQIVKDAEAMCAEHSLKLTVDLPKPDSTSVYANVDVPRIAQVFNNLLHNACKFTERGGNITVALKTADTHVEIRVIDTGAGIPPQQLQFIFEMFTQLELPGSNCAGGLGIGLSLARSIVEMHGGSLEAQSQGLGYGSEFIVRLPSFRSPKPSTQMTRVDKSPVAVKPQLIVAADDNADALHAVTLMLRMKGHRVKTAENGLVAIELIRALKPDVALLDIGMPGIDGYEVARRIRREPWGDNILIIATTGWGQKRDKQNAYDAGFDLHLTKPLNLTQLQEYIAEKKGKQVNTGN